MDITAANFEKEVVEASAGMPVLVDFWAPWCAPCRALGPVLDNLAREFAGRVRIVKVNSDEESELAAAFGVRSIPDVVAFRDGRPVAHFLGAQPESQVRAFIERLLPSEDELRVARAEALVAEGRHDEAERLLDEVRPDVELDARVEALRAAIRFARAGGDEAALAARLAADSGDLEARFALAERHAGARRYREALEELLRILGADKEWRGGVARREILNIFNLARDQPDLVSEYRRRLATTLY